MAWGGLGAAGIVGAALLVAAACATRSAVEQRTTQGPTARELWTHRVLADNGREPTFDERQHWERALDRQISNYLAEHPEVANSLDVSTFRFFRRVAVGMSKAQVMILLGAPLSVTMSAAEMETLARKYWPGIEGNATEAWTYPLGWRLFFAGERLIDITQYLPG
jgi:hypothetical protein